MTAAKPSPFPPSPRPIRIKKVYRRRGGEYSGLLIIDGRAVGRVERDQTTGFHGDIYRAVMGGREIASGRTLSQLKDDLTQNFLED